MPNYQEILNEIIRKTSDYFKSAENQENNDPFSFNVIDAFESSFEDTKRILTNAAQQAESSLSYYNTNFQALTDEYHKKEHELFEKFKNEAKSIRSKYEEKTKILDDDIKEKGDEISFEERTKLQDIDFFFFASEQNMDLFQREYEENITRFNYQIQVANESYAQNTIHYNDILASELEEIKKEYENVINDYDTNTESIMRRYSQNKIELTQQLSEMNEKMELMQNGNKALKRKDVLELNEKIHVLMDKRNKIIQDARNTYAQQLAASHEEKENKRQQFQTDTQKINKDFIMSMSAYDEKLNKAKNELSEAVKNENRELQYRLFELKCEQEKELLELYKKGNPSKASVRRTKSSYYRYYETEKKNTDKAIKGLNRNFLKENENIAYSKKLADIDRNVSIKNIIDQDNNNIKIYQEIDNGYECEMNQTIDNANMDFNRNALLLRTQNTISSLELEKNSDEADANFEKEIEGLTTKIKNIDFEMQSFQEIRNLIHKYEDTKYEITKKFKTVYNVLEIEKCKVLDTLNHAMYDLNRQSSEMVLTTSRETENLKNKEYEIKTKNVIERNKLVYASEVKLAEYQKLTFKNDMETELLTLRRNYYFELDTIGHTYLSNKFRLEYKLLNQSISMLSKIQQALYLSGIKIINYIFNTITLRPEYFKNIHAFLRGYLLLLINSFEAVADCFLTYNNQMIDERFEFEKDIQYKGYYKNLENEYKTDMDKISTAKKAVLAEIDRTVTTIENNRNMMFSLENDLSMKRSKLKTGETPAVILKEEIAKIFKEGDALALENQKLNRSLVLLNRELQGKDNEIERLNESYARSQDEIKKMQQTNAIAYSEYKKNLTHKLEDAYNDISEEFRAKEIPTNELSMLEDVTKELYNSINSKQLLLISDLYEMSESFMNKEKDSIVKTSKIMNSGYKTDLDEIRKDRGEIQAKCASEFQKGEQSRKRELQEYDRAAALRLTSIKDEMEMHEAKIKEETDRIQEEMKIANQTFYDDYYAICDNQKDMADKQSNDMKELTLKHQLNHDMVENQYAKNILELKMSFKEYTQNKDEIIKRLPEAQKNRESSINLECSLKSQEMDQGYTDIKNKYLAEKKEIQRNMSLNEMGLRTNIENTAKECRINKQREKKLHFRQLKKISAK